jgi:hypothetical protein
MPEIFEFSPSIIFTGKSFEQESALKSSAANRITAHFSMAASTEDQT